MERKYLKDLGLADDVIEKIMTENGKDVTKANTERDGYKTQLETAQTTLKSFEGVDVNDLKGQITKLTNDLTVKDTTFKAQLADIEFSGNLEKAVAGSKARNTKAVMALLDVEKLKTSKNQQADITAALDSVKKENAYLFETERASRVVASTPGATKEADDAKVKANEGLRSFFGKGGE